MRYAECPAAARTKLKKLQKEAAAKAQAAANDLANKGPKERSPHTKEVRTAHISGVQHYVALARDRCEEVIKIYWYDSCALHAIMCVHRFALPIYFLGLMHRLCIINLLRIAIMFILSNVRYKS